MSPTLCHIADIHLGYRRFTKLTRTGQNQREADVNMAFHEAVGRIIECKPALTIIAGDLFHSPRPSNATITFAFREVRRLVRGTDAPVIIITGNHDSPKRSDTGSIINLFREIDGVYAADNKREIFEFPQKGISVCAVPFRAVNDLKENPPLADDKFRYNVLLIHGQVPEAGQPHLQAHFELESLKANQWDYVALGHVHRYQTIGLNTVYPGATERTTSNIWSEAQVECGFVEYDLADGKKIYHRLTSPREVTVLSEINAEGASAEALFARIKEAVNSVPGGIEGKMVRLNVRNVQREVVRQLPHKELRILKAPAVGFLLDISVQRTGVSLQEGTDRSYTSLEEELKRFAAGWKRSSRPAKEISDLLINSLKKVEVRDEA
jgi:exonuclease SbcD